MIRDKQARDILLRMVANFPGLYDGEQDVNGADLVDWIGNEINALNPDPELEDRWRNGTPEDD